MNNFKVVKGFSNYIINDSGEIFSKKWNKFRKLKPALNELGYLNVGLRKDGKTKMMKVHRLVLMTFDRPPKKGEECRHLDGNSQNNKLKNLAWSTHKINMKDMHKHGTAPVNEKHGSCKLSNKQVQEIRDLYKTCKFTHRGLGNLFNVSHVQIGYIVNNKLRKI